MAKKAAVSVIDGNQKVGEASTKSKEPRKFITRIKIKAKDASLIAYEKTNEQGELETSEVQFYGAIHPDFETVLDSLLGIVVSAVGLDEAAWTKTNCHVTGLSLKHDGPDSVGLTATAIRKVETDGTEPAAIVVNTPYLSSEFLSGDQNRIRQILNEAEKCMKGKRAQGNLFDQVEVEPLEEDG